MPREKIDFRETLGVLRDIHPGRVTLTVPEAAKAVGVCVKTLSRAIDSGSLPAQNVGKGKINKTYVVSLPALARWSLGG